jgi:hypothetical protein
MKRNAPLGGQGVAEKQKQNKPDAFSVTLAPPKSNDLTAPLHSDGAKHFMGKDRPMAELKIVYTIPELKVVILKKWEEGDSLAKRTRSSRLELGRLLVKLRERVEGGEEGDQAAIAWWEWYEDNFRRPRSEAEKAIALAMEAARTGDPAGTVARHRALDAARKAASRAQPKPQPISEVSAGRPAEAPRPEPVEYDEPAPALYQVPKAKPTPIADDQRALIEQALALFEQMEWPARKEYCKRIAARYRDWHAGRA